LHLHIAVYKLKAANFPDSIRLKVAADMALYKAKRAGHNHVAFPDEPPAGQINIQATLNTS
jgi:GGDEF domain-containing protein